MTKGTRNLHTINIRNQGKNIAGIYIYFYDNICLYVGESGNLGSRFKDHYNSSWRKPKLERRMARHLFFKEYREVLSVKWIEVDNEFDRRVIEGMLTRLLKPTYIEFRKNRRKSVKITYQ
nr:GIY-YIG nuclease family protein [Lederbergia lenta]